MYYLVYKITNTIDGKIYIGSHKTKNLNDTYMGSGKYLKHAQIKYGMENFSKEILFVFETPEEMYAKEAEIVNEDFLITKNTYNLKVGGFGGWDYANRETRDRTGQWDHINHGKHKDKKIKWVSEGAKNGHLKNGVGEAFSTSAKTSFLGKTHSDTTKRKIGEANSKNVGGKNSQFGTMWINNGSENRKIKRTDNVPEGFSKGRI